MAIFIKPTYEQHESIAERIGNVMGINTPAQVIGMDDWSMESSDSNTAILTVTLTRIISLDEANKILNAIPLTEEERLNG